MTRITLFVIDQLVPANHGSRVDALRRIHLLEQMGYELQVVMIARTADVEFLESAATDDLPRHILIGRTGQVGSVGALLGLLRWPWPMACRRPRAAILERLRQAVTRFRPDAVWVDGLYTAPWARQIARRLDCPWYYRSHNIEHQYMHGQWLAETDRVARFRLALCLLHLRRVETDVMCSAAHVFDISASDLKHWRARGVQRISWLPPLSARASRPHGEAPPTDSPSLRWDVGYFGNLNAPNNVEAIQWLLEDVLPRVRQRRPETRVVIAGSHPSEAVRQLCGATQGVDLVDTPAEIEPLYAQTRVLVNPALRGSGVNLKTIDMVASGRPMVVTDVGAGGLPDDLRSALAAPADVDGFAERLLSALEAPTPTPEHVRQAARRLDDAARQALMAVLPPPHSRP